LAKGGETWPTGRASSDGGAMAHLRRQHEARRLRGGMKKLVAWLASPGEQRIQRIDGEDRWRRLRR
jgi:hypothetical protein